MNKISQTEGRITVRKVTTHRVEIDIPPLPDVESTDEVVVVLNGRAIRRYAFYQADRAGLLREGDYR
jgi:hypothetical protein